MWRVSVINKQNNIIAQNFNTKDKADTWILDQAEKIGIKKAITINKETKEKEIINFEEEPEKLKNMKYNSLSKNIIIRQKHKR